MGDPNPCLSLGGKRMEGKRDDSLAFIGGHLGLLVLGVFCAFFTLLLEFLTLQLLLLLPSLFS